MRAMLQWHVQSPNRTSSKGRSNTTFGKGCNLNARLHLCTTLSNTSEGPVTISIISKPYMSALCPGSEPPNKQISTIQKSLKQSEVSGKRGETWGMHSCTEGLSHNCNNQYRTGQKTDQPTNHPETHEN